MIMMMMLTIVPVTIASIALVCFVGIITTMIVISTSGNIGTTTMSSFH